jgi:hypothetical protein
MWVSPHRLKYLVPPDHFFSAGLLAEACFWKNVDTYCSTRNKQDRGPADARSGELAVVAEESQEDFPLPAI